MIPFFRKIRKQYSDDHQVFKYLRYAIGEIFLVVIGILIALQINNWNESQKAKNEAVKALYSLKKEFESNKEIIDSSVKLHRESLDAAKAFTRVFYPDSLVSKDSLNQIARSFFSTWKYEPLVATIDAIVASGKLDLIDNEELTGLIRFWKTGVQKYNELYQIKDTYQRQEVLSLFVESFSIRGMNPSAKEVFEVDPYLMFKEVRNENLFLVMEYQMNELLNWTEYMSELQGDILERLETEIQAQE